MSSRPIFKNNKSELLSGFSIVNCYHPAVLTAQTNKNKRGQTPSTNRLHNVSGGYSPGKVGISNQFYGPDIIIDLHLL